MIQLSIPNLDRGSGHNAAAIPGFEILPCDHVDIWPGVRSGVLLGKIKLKEFRDWSKLYFADFTKDFSEKATNTNHGRRYVYQVSGFYPGDNEELRRLLGITEWIKFIVRIRDTQNMVRVIGNQAYGLELDYDSMISTEMGGQRGTMVTFSGELPDPSALEY